MKAIKLLQFSTVILVVIIALSGLVILFGYPGKMSKFTEYTTAMLIFIGPQIAAAFGGPALKRHQEAKKLNGGSNA